MVFSFSNILIQAAVNSLGPDAMAASAAAFAVEVNVYCVLNAFAQATTTFVSQNYGAGKPDRVRKTLWCCLGVVITIGLSMGLIIRAFGAPLMSLYNSDPEVIAMSRSYMSICFWMFLSCCLMAPTLGLINGVGNTMLNMIIALLDGVIARIGLSLLFGRTLGMGLEGFWLGNGLAGYVSVILAALYFFFGNWQDRRLLQKEP